jgi:hypothetical protein
MSLRDAHFPLYAYFGHHKCASIWIREIVSDVSTMLNFVVTHVSRAEDVPNEDLAGWLLRQKPDFFLYSNAEIRHVPAIGPLRGFHVVRDPRDLIVSAYFSHLYSHPVRMWPGLVEHRQRLQSLDETDGMLLEIEYSAPVIESILNWNYTNPDILEVHMEDLVRSPYEGFMHIFEFLGLVQPTTRLVDPWGEMRTALATTFRQWRHRVHARRVQLGAQASTSDAPGRKSAGLRRLRQRHLPPGHLLETVYRHRFETKTGGRTVGVENTHSHYRKGSPGDWVNHFKPVHIEAFKRRFGDGLVHLGYEKDNSWE